METPALLEAARAFVAEFLDCFHATRSHRVGVESYFAGPVDLAFGTRHGFWGKLGFKPSGVFSNTMISSSFLPFSLAATARPSILASSAAKRAMVSARRP